MLTRSRLVLLAAAVACSALLGLACSSTDDIAEPIVDRDCDGLDDNLEDSDDDQDGRPDGSDNCPRAPVTCGGPGNSDQTDSDFDTVGNVCDNCPATGNSSQADPDGDFIGSACDNCVDV